MSSSSSTSYVQDKYLQGVHEVRSQLRSYWLNHSFMLGHQWSYWSWDQNTLDQVANEGDRIQATMNRTRANMRVIMANLMQRELTFENPPMSYDDGAIRSARLGSQIIEDTRHAHYWETLREQLTSAAMKGGTSALALDWDSVNGDTVDSVLTIGEFIMEPGSIDGRKARYWIRRMALPTDEVWSMFLDHFGQKRPAADTVSSLDPYMHRIVSDQVGHSNEQVDRTHVYTYYERPNPLCPDGRILVEVGGEIVQHIEKWPFPFKDRLNITPIRETVVEGRWYGATFMDDVRPVQVALNAAWSNLLEHLRDAGTARLVVPTSAVDVINALTDLPGEILEYPDGTPPPEFLQPAQLSTWLRDMPEMLGEVIDNIMGVHDVSRGMAPANIESGLGLSILAENDSSPVGHLIKEVVRAFTEHAQMSLMLFEDNVKETRTLIVKDSTGPVRREWTGADIKGQVKIHIPMDAVIPRSRAALGAFADKAMEMGLISTVEQYALVAELPGQDAILAAASPDVHKARRENATFAQGGEVLIPASFDDHEIHMETHNNFRKTEAYELLDDDDMESVDLHIQAHETVLSEEIGSMEMDNEMSAALAAAPTADGPAPMDPALLGQGAALPMPPEDPTSMAGMEMPEPVPLDPNNLVNEMLTGLE